ncbi:MAG: polynucleotide adenylyltransferase PcnB [Spirochaetaceae bacterium]
MRVRYGTTIEGKTKPVAKIYGPGEHSIDPSRIDRDAVRVISRLKDKGYGGYIVGGAVRDLLLDKYPKDFDIATDATPRDVKKLFRNARIIGRRFRLVHVHFSDKILEVSTFRASSEGEGENNNVFGSIEEDVHRRDFSINALYYDPEEQLLIDYVDGFHDIKRGILRSLIPLNITFSEDPVRMIRAVKYAALHNLRIPFKLRRSLKKYSVELERCPPSRMTEEMLKILQSGNSEKIFKDLIRFRLLSYMLPVIDMLVKDPKRSDRERFFKSLQEIDRRVTEKGEDRKGRLLAALVEGVCFIPNEWDNTTLLFRDMFKEIKRLIAPLTPPNQEVEMAVVWLFREEGLKPPPNAIQKKRPLNTGKSRKPQAPRYKKR